jgi:multicomponent Na+:H+ antiporter subunit G
MPLFASILLITGALFVLIAAVGVLRLPDLLMRMHAATKAGTLGAGLLLGAVMVSVPETGVVVRAAAVVVFLLLTAPIAAHVIARAAYHAGEAQLWDRTSVDELADHLDQEQQTPERAEAAVERR